VVLRACCSMLVRCHSTTDKTPSFHERHLTIISPLLARSVPSLGKTRRSDSSVVFFKRVSQLKDGVAQPEERIYLTNCQYMITCPERVYRLLTVCNSLVDISQHTQHDGQSLPFPPALHWYSSSRQPTTSNIISKCSGLLNVP